jgi:hypothetical protein
VSVAIILWVLGVGATIAPEQMVTLDEPNYYVVMFPFVMFAQVLFRTSSSRHNRCLNVYSTGTVSVP